MSSTCFIFPFWVGMLALALDVVYGIIIMNITAKTQYFSSQNPEEITIWHAIADYTINAQIVISAVCGIIFACLLFVIGMHALMPYLPCIVVPRPW
jgi:uncharacterized protein YqhQ